MATRFTISDKALRKLAEMARWCASNLRITQPLSTHSVNPKHATVEKIDSSEMRRQGNNIWKCNKRGSKRCTNNRNTLFKTLSAREDTGAKIDI